MEKDLLKSNKAILIIIDIDKFQSLNSIYGYDIGNIILKKFAEFLSDYAFDKKYKVYRIFGDEFALYEEVGDFLDIKKYEKELNELVSLLHKFRFKIYGIDEFLDIDATIGLSIAQTNPMQCADTALRYAKKMHKDYVTYTHTIDNKLELKNSVEWTTKIKEALASNHIIPVYQPIVDREQNIIKYEVLMRILKITDEGYTLISPDKFLNIAIVTKQYYNIFSLMLNQVLRDIQRSDKLFSINISFSDMYDINFIKMLETSFSHYNNLENRLIFEILESEQIDDFSKINTFIDRFKDIGIKIAIDDFGTGYSNFSNVLEIKPDYIKVDGSIIKNIVNDKNALAMLKSIIFFSHEFNAKVIAEYISDEKIFQLAYDLGVDEFQGYYFSPPIENIGKFERNHNDK